VSRGKNTSKRDTWGCWKIWITPAAPKDGLVELGGVGDELRSVFQTEIEHMPVIFSGVVTLTNPS